jgi:uncharacterized SAM-binding protein YcdF (DUF218 family)
MYKIIISFLLPPGIFITVFVVTGMLLVRNGNAGRQSGRKKIGVILLIAGIFMYLFSIRAISNITAYPLEKDKTRIGIIEIDTIDSIIVLGGGVKKGVPKSEESGIRPTEISMQRLSEAVRIHNITAKKIIVTGGDPYKTGVSEAEISKKFLIELGIKESDIILEDRSKTTFENAQNCIEILKNEKLVKPVIVTSAIHINRATGSFEKAKIDAIYSASDYVYNDFMGIESFFPSGENIDNSRQALWEYIGILYYKISKKMK